MPAIIERGDGQWQVKARRRQWSASATFETKARAEMWARQVEGAIDARGFNSGSIEADRVSLHAALDPYLQERVPLKKGVKLSTGIVRSWQRTKLSAFPLSAIRGSDVAELRDQKLKDVGPQTVLHHLNLLSNLFNVAASDWGMESLLNPVSRVRKPALPTGRNRRLSEQEEAKLLRACDASRSPIAGRENERRFLPVKVGSLGFELDHRQGAAIVREVSAIPSHECAYERHQRAVPSSEGACLETQPLAATHFGNDASKLVDGAQA